MSPRVPRRADKHQGAARLLRLTPRLHLPAGLAHSQTSVPDCRIDQVQTQPHHSFFSFNQKERKSKKVNTQKYLWK